MSEIYANSDGELDMGHTSEHADPTCCRVVELRQYTLKPGRRDELIALFERHFLEGQEQYGLQILGQFRRRTDPDQFVWLRGFADMEARRRALQDFYFGPVWQVHRTVANDTMIDSDNVLLLKPVRATSGLHFDSSRRPAMDAQGTAGGMVIATVYAFDEPVGSPFVDFFETKIGPCSALLARRCGDITSRRPQRTRFPNCLCAKASMCSSGSPPSPMRRRMRPITWF